MTRNRFFSALHQSFLAVWCKGEYQQQHFEKMTECRESVCGQCREGVCGHESAEKVFADMPEQYSGSASRYKISKLPVRNDPPRPSRVRRAAGCPQSRGPALHTTPSRQRRDGPSNHGGGDPALPCLYPSDPSWGLCDGAGWGGRGSRGRGQQVHAVDDDAAEGIRAVREVQPKPRRGRACRRPAAAGPHQAEGHEGGPRAEAQGDRQANGARGKQGVESEARHEKVTRRGMEEGGRREERREGRGSRQSHMEGDRRSVDRCCLPAGRLRAAAGVSPRLRCHPG